MMHFLTFRLSLHKSKGVCTFRLADVKPETPPTAVGGVFVIKEKERSSKIVISAGIIEPAWELVRSLYSLQKAMMLTPCWPREDPTGGAGFACPAGICNLM